MSIPTQINQIIDRRIGRNGFEGKGHLQAVVQKRAFFGELLRTLEDYQTLRENILGQIRNHSGEYYILSAEDPDMQLRVEQADPAAAILQTQRCLAECERLEKRFNRETLNISVVGRARQGKSRLLQALSGLPNEVIPASDGGDCTGAKSVIANAPGHTRARVTFYNDTEMVSQIQKYLDELRIPRQLGTLAQVGGLQADLAPSYIWGEGEINSQTSGTPNKTGEQKIVDAINNMDIGVGSISVDTSNIESYLRVGDGQTATSTVTDLINGIGTDTTNIESRLRIDDKTITELVNGIGTDTKNIENDLKVDDKTITELVNGIGTDTTNIENDLRIDDKTITELVNGIGTDTSNIMSTLKVSAGGFNYSAIDRLIVITSDIGELTKTAQPKYFKTARLSSIAANTLTQISPISSGYGSIRVFVEIRAIDPDAEFYVGFDNTLDDTNGRPVKGRILLSMPTTQSLYVYHTNESAIDIQQTEGWR